MVVNTLIATQFEQVLMDFFLSVFCSVLQKAHLWPLEFISWKVKIYLPDFILCVYAIYHSYLLFCKFPVDTGLCGYFPQGGRDVCQSVGLQQFSQTAKLTHECSCSFTRHHAGEEDALCSTPSGFEQHIVTLLTGCSSTQWTRCIATITICPVLWACWSQRAVRCSAGMRWRSGAPRKLPCLKRL